MERREDKSKCSTLCFKKWILDNLLLILTLIGVVVGFILVPILQPLDLSDNAIMWIALPGELFMRGLKCMVIPVLSTSVITATASLEPKSNGKMSGVSCAYMGSMVFFGVVVGIILSVTIQPGNVDSDITSFDYKPAYYETQDVIADLFRNMIPDNIIKACVQSIRTTYEFQTTDNNGTNTTEQVLLSKSTDYGFRSNLLGVLIFSAVFGAAMCFRKEETRTMFQFMWELRTISMDILTVFLWALPVATASLICNSMIRVDDMAVVWEALGKFAGTVIAGLAIHIFITVSLTFFILTRKNPFRFQFRCLKATITAMITKTNAAILPLIFRVCEVNNRINKTVSNYVVPLNVAFKTDGSALFIVSAAMWLAQSEGMSLNAGQVVTMGIVSWIMGLSLPAVPSASLVAVVTVCSSVGIPSYNIGLLISMEWLLDTLRTGVNCSSHCCCAGIVDSIMKKGGVDSRNIDDQDRVSNEKVTMDVI
ncbi:excitatory amino acid transporter 3-like [Saccoglossus kowalevskii]|uniref:Amino acid transporter n=1 Tax=Saccoglossus kowalevskii TaxID=10224 RepID=A0ABM0MRR6_SACKO|nr:PREDICTED: excitatory amino acid transporter 3-like [Saccoglossus kowalevskii]